MKISEQVTQLCRFPASLYFSLSLLPFRWFVHVNFTILVLLLPSSSLISHTLITRWQQQVEGEVKTPWRLLLFFEFSTRHEMMFRQRSVWQISNKYNFSPLLVHPHTEELAMMRWQWQIAREKKICEKLIFQADRCRGLRDWKIPNIQVMENCLLLLRCCIDLQCLDASIKSSQTFKHVTKWDCDAWVEPRQSSFLQYDL